MKNENIIREQTAELRKITRTTGNCVFVSTSETGLERINIQTATANKISKILKYVEKDCNNLRHLIRYERIRSDYLRLRLRLQHALQLNDEQIQMRRELSQLV